MEWSTRWLVLRLITGDSTTRPSRIATPQTSYKVAPCPVAYHGAGSSDGRGAGWCGAGAQGGGGCG